jgi:hypothetical protein
VVVNYAGNEAKKDIHFNEDVKINKSAKGGEKKVQSFEDKLKSMQDKYNKTGEELGEIFVRASGDLDLMDRFLKGERVSLWNYLEDNALEKPEDSDEFLYLMEVKGIEEIEKRKKFLISQGEEDC